MRSLFRSSTSGKSGSWKGSLPARRASIRSGITSRTITWCPSSAKQPPVTSPTQPAPKTPIVRDSAMAGSLLGERSEASRDGEHGLVRELVEDRVDDPVGRPVFSQHDHVEMAAGVVQRVLAPADLVNEAGLGKHRRVVPVRPLDPPVLFRADAEGQPNRPVALADVV